MSQLPPLPAVANSNKTLLTIEKESIADNFPISTKLTAATLVKKRRRKRQDPQACPAEFQNEDFVGDDSSPMSSTDVEAFQGKIVYNFDANSAYIIDNYDNGPNSLADPSRNLRSQSCNTERKIQTITDNKQEYAEVRKLDVDCEVSKVAIINSELNTLQTTSPKQTTNLSNPRIHSFRVVSAHDAFANAEQREPREENLFKKIQKPILMCFICKLSFGNTKSFSLHANTEHNLNLQDLEIERSLLKREYSSAIIQRNMDEKPQISFLEPLGEEEHDNENIRIKTENERPIDSNKEEIHKHVDKQNISSETTSEVNSAAKMDISAASNYSLKSVADENMDSNSVLSDGRKLSTTLSSLSEPKAKDSAFLTKNDTSFLESETTIINSPKHNALSASIAESEKLATNEVPVTQADNNRTDNLSSNNSAAALCNSNNIFNETDDIEGKNENKKLCSIPLSEMAPITISTTVADFLHQQLQHLASPMHNVNTTSSRSPIQPLAMPTCEVDGDISAFSLPPLLTTTLTATTSSQSKSHDSLNSAFPTIVSDPSSGSVQFLNELLLQHQLAFHQQQLQIQSQELSCPDHPDCSANDCKTCEAQQQSKLSQQQQNKLSLQTSMLTSRTAPNNGSNNSVPVTAISNISSVSPTSASTTSGMSNNPNTPIGSGTPSFTIGACSEHINGRPLGVDCVRCEMLLNSARLNSGVQISSTRNSCKTLKCPQCNWHYKYQETLEIHMREKHPDGESACGYCLAGQQHPRLARGESYSCGYKPYRCEICNYSTTTKGNLSIHMQSDKHLNNMQELNNSQNIVAAAAAAAAVAAVANNSGNKISTEANITPGSSSKSILPQSNNGAGSHNTIQQSTSGSSISIGNTGNTTSNVTSNKPRPSFRCDICSYETSVARNLRIHMTSEKHTHNMAVLQNNIKHIQAFSYLQQQHQQASAVAAAAAAAANSNLSGLTQNVSSAMDNTSSGNGEESGGNSAFMPEVALADLAFNQAMMIQLQLHLQQNVAAVALAQQQQIMCKSPNKTSATSPNAQSPQNPSQRFSPRNKSPTMIFSDFNGSELCMSSTSVIGEQTMEGDMTACGTPDLFPSALYSCLVCATFNTNSLDELQQHLLLDRSRNVGSSNDIMLIHNNNYICRLCNYKTNLKANFQLHSKTDKHLQKLNFVNHIREGGARNEYKLKFQQQQQFASNTVQLKCNCCDFYTNSIQKLSLHIQHMRHETMRAIFQRLHYLLMKEGNEHIGVEKSLSTSSFQSTTGTKRSTEVSSNNEASLEPASDSLEKQTHGSRVNSAKTLLCQLCNYSADSLLDMVRHAKSLRHLQVEQFICLQRRSENLEVPSLVDIFKISQNNQQMPEETALTMTSLDCSDDYALGSAKKQVLQIKKKKRGSKSKYLLL